jgi:hypothetical protein
MLLMVSLRFLGWPHRRPMRENNPTLGYGQAKSTRPANYFSVGRRGLVGGYARSGSPKQTPTVFYWYKSNLWGDTFHGDGAGQLQASRHIEDRRLRLRAERQDAGLPFHRLRMTSVWNAVACMILGSAIRTTEHQPFLTPTLCNGWAERKYGLFRSLRFAFVRVWGRWPSTFLAVLSGGCGSRL